jgi:RimJ/RimL family protein N-acetyltransferase
MERQFGLPTAGAGVDEAAAGRWIAARQRERAEGSAFSWAVTDGGAVLGCVAVSRISRAHDTGWVSYWTVTAARGRGVATGGVRALAAWCFTELGLYRLELGHRTDNPASCRVATAAGFAVEGVQRARLRYGTTRHDVELHARLASDA